MSKKKKNKKKNQPASAVEVYQGIRKEWPKGFSPVTRVKGDKRKQNSKTACRGNIKF